MWKNLVLYLVSACNKNLHICTKDFSVGRKNFFLFFLFFTYFSLNGIACFQRKAMSPWELYMYHSSFWRPEGTFNFDMTTASYRMAVPSTPGTNTTKNGPYHATAGILICVVVNIDIGNTIASSLTASKPSQCLTQFWHSITVSYMNA